MKKILLLALLSLGLFGAELHLKNGSVAAHTEMLMDKTIDPFNNALQAAITMQNGDITTMQGKFWVEMSLFKSDKSDRDEHMYKEVDTLKYKLATYTISSVTKVQDNLYTIKGKLDFHGVSRELEAKAKITAVNSNVTMDATSMILVSEYGIKMPCMVFMCVRDQVDLSVKASFEIR
ncbi:MAG: YceI family protein [Sulfurimonas sp.]|uniref:YceI family protein n=1 Tax=Sulfurimonas sp. TaxID=2022749 RepID=UPI002634BAE0|nr:YceI family protein [Sulfurimonas sp.]MDD2653205.1 YceI family protein [Sulfurimonas sp.]MDD3452530.1 YceI family protein [Sulfurimonas sp.]